MEMTQKLSMNALLRASDVKINAIYERIYTFSMIEQPKYTEDMRRLIDLNLPHAEFSKECVRLNEEAANGYVSMIHAIDDFGF